MSGDTSGMEHRHAFDLFGSRVNLLIGPPLEVGLPSQEVIALQLEGFLRTLQTRLTRFEPESELCRLNSCAQEAFPASSALVAAVQAGIWAAARSNGLVDPTLVDEIEAAGYRYSRKDAEPAPLADAIASAPERLPARPRPDSRWREISVDPSGELIRRPPGVRIDCGGFGKGLAADLVADRLLGFSIFAVDAGGDIRIGGESPAARQVTIPNPLTGGVARELEVDAGAVATSGIATRVWRTKRGFNHHLLDPATGEPAWTGVVQASALAPTALEAETLAKTAFMLGPERGAQLLAERGGVLILDDGEVLAFEKTPSFAEAA